MQKQRTCGEFGRGALMCGLHSEAGEGESGGGDGGCLAQARTCGLQRDTVGPDTILDNMKLILEGFVWGLRVLRKSKERAIVHNFLAHGMSLMNTEEDTQEEP